MNELKIPSDEVVCDYCHIRYPDKRSLLVHEVIHVDDDIDSYFTRFGILNNSDYLPKAKQLLPNGIRNNRFIESNHRRIVSRCGKHYSKVFDVSEAIAELLELCKKYPLRKSPVKACEELLEGIETPIAEKVPIYLSSPQTSISSSYFEASPVSSPSRELGSNDSGCDQNKAQNQDAVEKAHYEDEQNSKVSPDPILNKESLSDKGYSSSPEEHCSEIAAIDSKNTAVVVYSRSENVITDLIDNLVSEVDLLKLSRATDKFRPNIESSAPDECAMQQNIKFDFQTSDKSDVEAFESVDENSMIDENHQFQTAPDFRGSDIPSFEAFASFDKNMISDKNIQIHNVLYASDKHDFEMFGTGDENMMVENHQIENVTDVVYSMPFIC